MDLSEFVPRDRTALVTVEVQDGVVGEGSFVPELAHAAEAILPNIAQLCRAARSAGIPVLHCTADGRSDGFGGNRNARLFGMTDRPAGRVSTGGKTMRATVHAAIGPEEGDLVMGRLHGVSPMTDTSLDPVLRNSGITTIVAVGVSVNVALLGLAFEAVNHGYGIVIARDAVAGVDDAYVDAVFQRTLSLLATITTTAALLDLWAS